MPLPLRPLLLAVLVVAVAASGCTAGGAPGPTYATTRGVGEVVGDWDGVVAFANAVMAEDTSSARRHVAPGSPAERYLAYTDGVAAASAGRPKPSPGTWRVGLDRHSGVVMIGTADGATLTWTDWRFDASGKILQWSTPTAGALESRLVRPSADVRTDAGTFAVASGLVNDDALTLVVKVTAGSAPLRPDCAASYTVSGGVAGSAPAAAPSGAHEPGASPSASSAAGERAPRCSAPALVPAGQTATVALNYPGGRLGGRLSYRFLDAAGTQLAAATVPVA